MNYIRHYFSKYYLPRWFVLIFDMAVVYFSWFMAFLLRFNFDLSNMEQFIDPRHLAIVFPISLFCFWKFKSYSGILRHSTTRDAVSMIFAIFCIVASLFAISLVGRVVNAPSFVAMPLSVIVIFASITSTILVLSRLMAKVIFQFWFSRKETKKVMVFGAGRLGQTAFNALVMDTSVNYEVVAFIDDNVLMQNKHFAGVPICSIDKAFGKVINEHEVVEVIIAIDNSKITTKRKMEITDLCLKYKIKVKEVPPLQNWINGELHSKSIRPINIEDLLGRNSIKLDRDRIEKGLKNSVVLVTGAAGSIGSEIVRQLVEFNVRKVILLDKAESDLFNLQQEIKSKKSRIDFEVIVGDVTNEAKLRRIFMKYGPTIVFNAAAYKHVPLMEEFPSEAVRVNIGGVKVIADLSVEFGVEKFVFISTDKAVNPTNVMGASKRISEIYIQALAQSGKFSTQFITTRFGNVLGSNGSVVPTFKKQIEKGGPVTITHKDITRYFMTIPEACQLVLEAGFMGKGGEIFVFDMGEPVRIYDLAEKMISLSGFVPHQDIKIEIVGLRPGEKLYEELLSNSEIRLNHTYNEKIMIGKDKHHNLMDISEKINDLIEGMDEMSRYQLVKQMMRIVPEFNSMNSYYSNGEDKSAYVGPLYGIDKKIDEQNLALQKVKALRKRKSLDLSEKF